MCAVFNHGTLLLTVLPRQVVMQSAQSTLAAPRIALVRGGTRRSSAILQDSQILLALGKEPPAVLHAKNAQVAGRVCESGTASGHISPLVNSTFDSVIGMIATPLGSDIRFDQPTPVIV